jgi:hypothetical protein
MTQRRPRGTGIGVVAAAVTAVEMLDRDGRARGAETAPAATGCSGHTAEANSSMVG